MTPSRLSRGRSMAVCLLAVLAWPGVLPSRVAAQSALDRIDRLVEDGRVSEARGRLLDWWEGEWDDASRRDREQALWIRGRLTLEPVEASAIYRRMVVEHPVGAFTDRVLARLGTLAAIEGDTLAAHRWYQILQRDFPTSPPAARAERWLDGNDEAVDRARDRGAPPARPVVSAARGDWTVQFGAFAGRERAEGFADDLRDAGFEIRVVQVEGSDLWRVRSGRFPDDGDARDLYDRVRAAGFDAAIVPGAGTERGR